MFLILAVLENESIPKQMSTTFKHGEWFGKNNIRHDDDWTLPSRKVMEKFMNGLIVVFEGNRERYKA